MHSAAPATPTSVCAGDEECQPGRRVLGFLSRAVDVSTGQDTRKARSSPAPCLSMAGNHVGQREIYEERSLFIS